MKVLVVGSGGRESALVAALVRDPHVDAIVCAPGNPGTEQDADNRPLDLGAPDVPGLIADLAEQVGADLTIVGPEAPLVAGAADELRLRGLACFGPNAAAARLEGSKAFAKEVMEAAGVPTARGRDHHDVPTALADLDEFGPPYVVKFDGLAAGKGVTVTDDHDVAAAAVRAALTPHAGDATPPKVVLEEFLPGPEVSLFCVVGPDGTVVPLSPAQDFKRAYDGDAGPNTGGMGAYSPLPWTPADLSEQVVRTIAQPTVAEMARRGTPFSGLLYVGLALTPDGPKVIEFNVRFGDPETQAVLARLDSPLTELLAGGTPIWSSDAAVTVVVAAPGYPEAPRTGGVISGLDAAAAVEGVSVQHAGTRRASDGSVVSAGGRVLAVTGRGSDLAAARECAYEAVAKLSIAGGLHVRTDIALHRIAAHRNDEGNPGG